MYSHSDIEDAVAGGAVSAEQAASLRKFVAARTGTPTADEEHVRILQGFNDLYVYTSSILLMFGLGWLGSKIDTGSGPSFFIPLLIGLACWGLSEFFVKRKRLALTGITLAWLLVYSVYFTVILVAAQILGPGSGPDTGKLVSVVAALIACGVAFLHWKRFDEPISVSLIAATGAIAVMSLVSLVAPDDPNGTLGFVVLALLGVGTLFFALTWEGKDIYRISRKADIAFWLQMTAAWETIIGLAGVIGMFSGPVSQGEAIAGILLFVVAMLVGVVLDRRIWVLAAAWPLGMGIHTLIRGDLDRYSAYGDYASPYGNPYGGVPGYGMGRGGSTSFDDIMLTILIVAVILLALAMVWTRLRAVLGGLAGPLAGRVPPARPAQGEEQPFQ